MLWPTSSLAWARPRSRGLSTKGKQSESFRVPRQYLHAALNLLSSYGAALAQSFGPQAPMPRIRAQLCIKVAHTPGCPVGQLCDLCASFSGILII